MPPEYPQLRMYRFERLLHVLLVVSFVVLAASGFQLKYPDQWWARQTLALEGGATVRGIVHRSAAVVFLLAAVLHLVSLISSRRLRLHWLNLLPRYTDVAEAARGFAWRMGFGSAPPRLSPYSYIEKAEYWAVLWGGVVMTATGILLWADNLTLKWFPKELLDFATALHFYEALLACLAIVVWHFYMVIFDPDVYPMDTAWIEGNSVRRHDEEEEPCGSVAQRAQAPRW
jgi:cytochrome b subunit of formate dehydrogenase